MQVDYIVVGCGLAGIHFCEQLEKNNKSFVVFDDGSQQSSVVAGGLYNPVVLKRFTPVWKSKTQLALVTKTYANLEKKLGVTLDYKIPVLRKFSSVSEQNNWLVASDKPNLQSYLSPKFVWNANKAIQAPYGFGKVNQTGRINTAKLIASCKMHYQKQNRLIADKIDYNALQLQNNITYKNITAKHIVFAEGFGLKQNPFFNYLPLKGTKGELITILAPELIINYVLKSNVFLIPLQNHRYLVGATYQWEDKTNNITKQAKQVLVAKLKTCITCNFTVENQVAGIRPTVIDRRPLVGTHTKHKNLHVLNGLGTRGVMIAPYVAEKLFQHIENNMPLDAEIDINRFTAI